MTLDSRVYVHDPIDHQTVFGKAREILLKHDDKRRQPADVKVDDDPWNGHRALMTAPMQGLPGWLMVLYRPDAPLRTPEQAAAHDDHCNAPGARGYDAESPLCDPAVDHRPGAWLEVSVDTAYGWRGASGANCGSLHAAFIAELGQWLDAQVPSWCDVHDALEGTCRPDPTAAGCGVPCAASPTRNPRQDGVRWSWLNEYTGHVHQGYDALPGLVGSSDQANAWFDNEVRPVLARLTKGDL